MGELCTQIFYTWEAEAIDRCEFEAKLLGGDFQASQGYIVRVVSKHYQT